MARSDAARMPRCGHRSGLIVRVAAGGTGRTEYEESSRFGGSFFVSVTQPSAGTINPGRPQRRQHEDPASSLRKRSAPPPTVRSRNGLSESRTGAGTIRSPEKNALKKAEGCNKVQIANQQRFIHMTPEKGLRSYRTKKHRSESIAFRESRRGPVPARKVGCDPQGRAAYRIRRGACPAEDPGTGRKTSAPTLADTASQAGTSYSWRILDSLG